MGRGVHRRWAERQTRFVAWQSQASDVGGLTAVAAKLVQTMQGSLLLGAAVLAGRCRARCGAVAA